MSQNGKFVCPKKESVPFCVHCAFAFLVRDSFLMARRLASNRSLFAFLARCFQQATHPKVRERERKKSVCVCVCVGCIKTTFMLPATSSSAVPYLLLEHLGVQPAVFVAHHHAVHVLPSRAEHKHCTGKKSISFEKKKPRPGVVVGVPENRFGEERKLRFSSG